MVRISVIIPSFNQGQFLEDAILSVLHQGYPDIEILVMDGGSTDNSCEVIQRYADQISFWQSQKDNGQSDAINQGIRRATGDIVTWLNSDDIYLPGTLSAVAHCAEKNPNVQWFLGNVLWLDKEGRVIRVGKVEKESAFWNRRHLFSNGGPSAFMRRTRLVEIGMLREDFHYMMDTELWHRYISHGDMFLRIPQYCWGLRLHENAKMSGHNFENSKLADLNHPSWIAKRRESSFVNQEYPVSSSLRQIWSIWRIAGAVLFSRFSDRKLMGRQYCYSVSEAHNS